MTATGSLQISARISNQVSRDVDEVVQLYLRDRTASVVRPVRELEDFRRVRLPGGGNVTVQFELRRAHLIFVGQAMTAIAKPGLLDVWLAPSASADGLPASFGLLGLCLLRRPAWRRWSSTRVHGRAAPRLITHCRKRGTGTPTIIDALTLPGLRRRVKQPRCVLQGCPLAGAH
ncbi:MULTISPECIES: fibronectin type III-like domain-contianing protein [Xanthomonas]|uniref:fibronectin type III-like domain-contianing protein n=1 Tax=Xanthomonas TaxID=338 RepID=UPI001CB77930|nr:fibronectin type III-like domain-contianing protein [Xanthomonas cucurbitae]